MRVHVNLKFIVVSMRRLMFENNSQPCVCVCVCVGGWVGGWVGAWMLYHCVCTFSIDACFYSSPSIRVTSIMHACMVCLHAHTLSKKTLKSRRHNRLQCVAVIQGAK
jgi:hypothetical protein